MRGTRAKFDKECTNIDLPSTAYTVRYRVARSECPVRRPVPVSKLVNSDMQQRNHPPVFLTCMRLVVIFSCAVNRSVGQFCNADVGGAGMVVEYGTATVQQLFSPYGVVSCL